MHFLKVTVKRHFQLHARISDINRLFPLGLTLRLKGKKIIPENGEVNITDLPVGGCRSYDTLECLSDVPYRGRVEKAFWKYTDPDTCEEHMIDDIRCKDDDDHKCWKFGWQSTLGIYKKGKKYYSVVRLGRRFENATAGYFTCYFEEDSTSPVSVAIGECEVNSCVIFLRTLYMLQRCACV